MKRVLFLADSHFSEQSRLEECVRLHDHIASEAEQLKVDLVCHGGDLLDHKSSIVERRAVADWLKRIAEIAPTVIVRGNHSVLGDLPIFGRLRTKHPITIEEGAGVHHVAGVAVATMAWPNRAALLASLGDVASEQANQVATEALRAMLSGLGQEIAAFDGPKVFLAHGQIGGAVTSAGQPMAPGADFELSQADISLARADISVLGHIHKFQSWDFDGRPILYTGSPRRCAFDELEPKGFVLAEFDRGEVRWIFVEVPATPMILVTAKYEGNGLIWIDQPVSGAEVKLRVTTASDTRDAAKVAASELRDKMIADGALMVRVEEVVETTTRARAPEVAAAKTLWDKCVAFWASKGASVEGRAERLRAKVAELEGGQ